MKLQIYDYEVPEKLCELSVGEHCLGHGSLLQCWDDGIPVKAISIVISVDTITMRLIAPEVECWHRTKHSAIPLQLHENTSIVINNGDCFSLNSQHNWYKIVVATSDHIDEQTIASCTKIKQEPLDSDCNASGSTSANTACKSKCIRDRCWYMDRCYRRNEKHKAKFSHIGDADFDTDIEDDRPLCQYGGQCYRRNANHRRTFKHSRNGSLKRKQCNADLVQAAAGKQRKRSRSAEESVSEADEMGPNETDDNSDEHHSRSDSENDDDNAAAAIV